MKKLQLGALLILLLALGAGIAIQQLKVNRLAAENADLRSQLAQLGSLQEANDTLAQQLKTAAANSEANQSDLLRLRSLGPKLRQLEEENVQLKSQQLTAQLQRSQAAAASLEKERPTAISTSEKPASETGKPSPTDLGSLELQSGLSARFDLGGGTNCTITPTALADGNNLMEIQLGATNVDGSFHQLGQSRLTARPGQQCAISVGDRMIALAVTLKP
jgi:hypothetical protein